MTDSGDGQDEIDPSDGGEELGLARTNQGTRLARSVDHLGYSNLRNLSLRARMAAKGVKQTVVYESDGARVIFAD